MSEQLQLRRGAASQVTSGTPAQGEPWVDTTNNRICIGDGSTAGGWPAAKLAEVVTNTRTTVSDANYSAQTTDRMIAYHGAHGGTRGDPPGRERLSDRDATPRD